MQKLSQTLQSHRWHRLSMAPQQRNALSEEHQDGLGDQAAGYDDRHEASGQASSSDNLVTLEIGSNFAPIDGLALWPMQSSLQLLNDTAEQGGSQQGGLLGLVCDVKLHRARYTLSVSSAVEGVNWTAGNLELRPPSGGPSVHAQHEATVLSSDSVTVPSIKRSVPRRGTAIRGQSLPLRFTYAGSDATCWGLVMRPSPAHNWASLLPVADAVGCALVMCGHSDEGGADCCCQWDGRNTGRIRAFDHEARESDPDIVAELVATVRPHCTPGLAQHLVSVMVSTCETLSPRRLRFLLSRHMLEVVYE